MKRSGFILFLLFSTVLSLFAQNDTLPHAVKLQIPASVADSLRRFDVSFDYSIFNRPYTDLYDFKPRESIQLETVGPNRPPVFYAKVGTQYPLIPTAELYLQSRPKNGFGIGLFGSHNSFIGSVPDVASIDRMSVRQMQNRVGGGITYDWATGEFMFDVRYDYNSFDYKLSDINPNGNKSVLDFTANFNSAFTEDNSLYYDITGGYTYTKFANSRDSLVQMAESFVHVKGYVGASFEIHRVYVDMNIEFATYSGLKNYSSGIVEFSPIYEYSRKFVSARLGAKFGSSFGYARGDTGQQSDLGAENSIFPDVDARFTLIDKALWIHAVAKGGNDLNPFSKLTGECCMLMPQSEILAGKRNVDASLAVESVIRGRLSLNLMGGYTMYTKKLVYCPVMNDDGPKRIMAGYLDANDLSFGMEVFWKSSDFTIGGKFTYNKYTNRETKEKVTELPAVTSNAFVRYSFRERLIASLDVAYSSSTGGMMYGAYEVPAIIDANINLNYKISHNFSVFAKCGNILNQRNQYVPLYVEPGRNFGGGICVNF